MRVAGLSSRLHDGAHGIHLMVEGCPTAECIQIPFDTTLSTVERAKEATGEAKRQGFPQARAVSNGGVVVTYGAS